MNWRQILACLDRGETPDLTITRPLQVQDPDRRTFLRLLLAAPIAATVDVETLIWTPKPIVTVAGRAWRNPNLGQIVAAAFEEYIRGNSVDNIFSGYWPTEEIKKGRKVL